MLIYLDHAWRDWSKAGTAPALRDLYDAVLEGSVERVRPKMMTVTAIMAGCCRFYGVPERERAS